MLIRQNKTFEDVILEEMKVFFPQFFDILQTKLLIRKILGQIDNQNNCKLQPCG